MSLAGPGNVDNDAKKAERGSRRRARGRAARARRTSRCPSVAKVSQIRESPHERCGETRVRPVGDEEMGWTRRWRF